MVFILKDNYSKIIFVDWVPIEQKSQIIAGIYIRRYHAWNQLNKMFSTVIAFRKKNESINWHAVLKMFDKNTTIWVEYGCGGFAHMIVLLACYLQFKNKLVLNVHDLAVKDQKDLYREPSYFKKLRLLTIEYLLFKRANCIILPAPFLLDWLIPTKAQKVIIMMPGIGEDELFISSKNIVNENIIKRAIYFGSMRLGGMIPQVIELFSKLDGWELLLVGPKEGAEIIENKNVKYLGVVEHDKLQKILDKSDVILICLPKKEYFDKSTPNKIAHSLRLCKPIIATKLKGISIYVESLGLEDNVIFLDEWTIETLKDALQKAKNLNIDSEKTISKMRTMAWEPRFRKVIEVAIDMNQGNNIKIEWI